MDEIIQRLRRVYKPAEPYLDRRFIVKRVNDINIQTSVGLILERLGREFPDISLNDIYIEIRYSSYDDESPYAVFEHKRLETNLEMQERIAKEQALMDEYIAYKNRDKAKAREEALKHAKESELRRIKELEKELAKLKEKYADND